MKKQQQEVQMIVFHELVAVFPVVIVLECIRDVGII